MQSARFRDQSGYIKRAVDHRYCAFAVARPLSLWAIPVELDAVAIGVIKLNRLAHAVLGCAGYIDSRLLNLGHSAPKRCAVGIDKSHMKHASMPFR
jgi:hypothetical protein